jgi:hypothetical protein
MNFPKLIAGALSIAGAVIFQCEPDVYTEETLRKAQRAVPLAIIYGKNDPIMAFRAGQYAATLFGEANWPAFRFFTDDTAGHMFAGLPVAQAIRWLKAQVSNNPEALIRFAASCLHEKAYRDAIAALRLDRDTGLCRRRQIPPANSPG